VVPLIVWNKQEYSQLPNWGLVKFSDMERQKSRTLFMRPTLKKRIIESFEQRKQKLKRCFRAFGCEPLFIEGDYHPDMMTQYFLQQTT